ncbi:unnamed protein product [Penicillium pancosmium]
MSHQFSSESRLMPTEAPEQSPTDREKAEGGQTMLRRSLAMNRAVMAKLLPYYFMCLFAIRSPYRSALSLAPYPWWEEEQCVIDSEGFISNIEKSIQEKLQTDGWQQEQGEQNVLPSIPAPCIDALVIAQYYIPAIEDWLRWEVEDPDDVEPVDGDIDLQMS